MVPKSDQLSNPVPTAKSIEILSNFCCGNRPIVNRYMWYISAGGGLRLTWRAFLEAALRDREPHCRRNRCDSGVLLTEVVAGGEGMPVIGAREFHAVLCNDRRHADMDDVVLTYGNVINLLCFCKHN